MTSTPTYRMKGKVVLRRIGVDRLLVPVSGGIAQENCVFPLNETGVFIWERLLQGVSLDETARAVAETFDVAADAAQADCQEFAGELVAQQLLEEVSA